MADLKLNFEEYTAPAKAPHPLTPVAQSIIDQGEGKIAAIPFSLAEYGDNAEKEARNVLKGLQTAARDDLNAGIRLHSLTTEGKGKDAVIVLRVRAGKKFTRNRGGKADTADAE